MTRLFSHPLRWLFYCLLLGPAPLGAQGPAMTSVTDVVYRANGQPAQGTILVSWPAFNTADGKPVAAGELSVAIGAQGNVSVQLAPNEGGEPGGTFYKAVYKLADGTTYTEYWVVPAASPTTIAAIRATVVPRQVGAQFVNRAYVDTAVANTHQQVVHKSGTETITGEKSFAASPQVPEPTSGAAAVNKDYVSNVVTLISQGFVDKAGDTMAGPLTLLTDPVAPGHATNRGYVDLRVNDMQAGLTNKLGRFNDTPINLAGMRFTPGFVSGGSIAEKINSGCADFGGAAGTVMVPSFEPTGISSAVPDDCLLWDLRGFGTNPYGVYSTGSRLKGWNFFHRMTAPNSDVANGSSQTNQTFGSFSIFTDIAQGGINNVGNKSNYEIFQVKALGAALGQKQAGSAIVTGMGYGDAIGFLGRCDGLGGIRTGGDEGCIGLYGQAWQALELVTYTGTVNGAPSGYVVTYSDGLDYNFGVGRPLLGALVYSTGTACHSNSGACPGTANASSTIEGVGTTWTSIPAPATDYCFSLDAATHNGLDLVYPITAITDDTTLTINGTWPTPETNAAGTYKIRKCSEITKVDRPNKQVTVVKGSLFSNGDAISAPVAHDNMLYAGRFSIRAAIASSKNRYGIQVNNDLCNGANSWCRGEAMYSGGGNWFTLFEASSSGVAPQRGFNLARTDALSPRQWFLSQEGSGGDGLVTDYITHTRHSSIGGNFLMRYTKSSPTDVLAFSGVQNYIFHIGNSGTSKSFDVRDNNSIPHFRVDGNANTIFVNNAADLFGYSGNQANEKWRITGSGGRATFTGGVCFNSASTLCDATGAGAPAGVCVTGSTYRQTDGVAAGTLYICENSAWTAVGGAAGASAWNALASPAGAQTLSMGAHTTTWTFNAATGASVDLVKLIDTASNTGTGHILSVETAASSNARPFQVKARGTAAFEVNEFGVISTLGSITTGGGISVQAGGPLTLKGRDDWSAAVTVSGADFSGSSSTASSTTIRGGDVSHSSGATTGGNLTLRSGGATSANGTPGNLQIAQAFQKDTTVTSGYLQCFKAAAAMTVGDCGNSAINAVGTAISASNTNPVVVQFAGVATLQFDSTASPSAGWFACTSASQGGKVAVQSGACAAGRQVGIVAQNGTNITSGKVFLQSR